MTMTMTKNIPIVHLLSSLPWCPEVLARLGISLFPWQVREGEGGESVPTDSTTTTTTTTTTSTLSDDPNQASVNCSNITVLPLHRCSRSRDYDAAMFPQAGRCSRNQNNTVVVVVVVVIRNPFRTGSGLSHCGISITVCLCTRPAFTLGHPWENTATAKHLFDAHPYCPTVMDPLTGFSSFVLADNAWLHPSRIENENGTPRSVWTMTMTTKTNLNS